MELVLDASRISGPEACRRVILVGELNPYGADPRYALYHEPAYSAGGRLQRLVLGVRARSTYLAMWRANLCTARWSDDLAAHRAGELCRAAPPALPWRLIVALGVRVSSAFARVAQASVSAFCEPVALPSGQTVVSLPHPSGLGRAYNDRTVVARARLLLASVAPDVPWGELERES